jgi:glucose/mannose transport system permease protein
MNFSNLTSRIGCWSDEFVPLYYVSTLSPKLCRCYIWQFTQAWNEFLFAVILTNQSHWPVTVALNNLAGSQLVQWNVLMAATLTAALPTLLVYLFLGRYFLRGLMAGALKG